MFSRRCITVRKKSSSLDGWYPTYDLGPESESAKFHLLQLRSRLHPKRSPPSSGIDSDSAAPNNIPFESDIMLFKSDNCWLKLSLSFLYSSNLYPLFLEDSFTTPILMRAPRAPSKLTGGRARTQCVAPPPWLRLCPYLVTAVTFTPKIRRTVEWVYR